VPKKFLKLKIKMKIKLLRTTLLFGSLMIASSMRVDATEPPTTTVIVDGRTYTLTYTTQLFSEFELTLTQQPWWGSATQAQKFVDAVGNELRFALVSDFAIANPYFAFGGSSESNLVDFLFSISGEGTIVVDSREGEPRATLSEYESGTLPAFSAFFSSPFAWAFVVPPGGPTTEDTLASFRPNAIALRNAFNQQSAKITQGLTYDCSVFDLKNVCVSFAGTKSDGKGFDSTTGALIIAHKPNANLRFGGYLDQAFNSSESGGLKVRRSDPGYGVFAVWSEKADGSGLQIRGSASFGKSDIETKRIPLELTDAEAGFGKSDIKSSGIQVEVSRDYAVNALWSARPYVGYRQVINRRGSYTESDTVVFPLAYSSIKQRTQSLLAGVRFAHTISAQTTMLIAAGLEHDIKNDVDRYSASAETIGDIDSIDMESGKKKTRPTISLGLTHDIDKTQRIGFSITHRKEGFESGSTTSGIVQYSRGF